VAAECRKAVAESGPTSPTGTNESVLQVKDKGDKTLVKPRWLGKVPEALGVDRCSFPGTAGEATGSPPASRRRLGISCRRRIPLACSAIASGHGAPESRLIPAHEGFGHVAVLGEVANGIPSWRAPRAHGKPGRSCRPAREREPAGAARPGRDDPGVVWHGMLLGGGTWLRSIPWSRYGRSPPSRRSVGFTGTRCAVVAVRDDSSSSGGDPPRHRQGDSGPSTGRPSTARAPSSARPPRPRARPIKAPSRRPVEARSPLRSPTRPSSTTPRTTTSSTWPRTPAAIAASAAPGSPAPPARFPPPSPACQRGSQHMWILEFAGGSEIRGMNRKCAP
jgi:hypothetical protein